LGIREKSPSKPDMGNDLNVGEGHERKKKKKKRKRKERNEGGKEYQISPSKKVLVGKEFNR
jgi:hypothetical protein